jgi:asparagine synthase (glutamine-hydrolysing)
MCGINGIYGVSKLENPKLLIEKMNAVTKHRGPDFSGVFVDNHVAFGHNRLAIIDLNSSSNQPFVSNDGQVVLVFNGEIYNYKEVKALLPEYDFKTNSDTEVIVAAYQKWGIGCVHQFNGMFAFAIWDKTSHKFYLVRDRLGIKPIYYFDNNQQFVFSSEMRGVMSLPFVDKSINPAAVADYIQYGTVHAPRTLLSSIKMLLPGHYLTITDEGLSITEYWDINEKYSRKSQRQSYDEVKEEVKTLFFKSVERRLIADVPFGAFLSGGIDSSAVVAAMSKVSSNKIKTFSITFDEEEFSEAKYARIIAEKYNTDHTEIKLTPEDFLKTLPKAIASMDHPSFDGVNSYVVSEATKKAGVTMALSGLGGDELFAGYDIFKRAHSLLDKKWMFSFPHMLRNFAGTAIKLAKPSVSSEKIAKILKVKYLELPYYYPINREIYSDEEVQKYVYGISEYRNAVKEIVDFGVGINTNGSKAPFLSRVSYAEINTYMQNVLLRDTDQMSMAHALEVRVPFLDYELVEYVYGVKDEFKYPHSPKKLLVDALGDLLPKEIVNRPKMGFTFPWDTWMRGNLKEYCVEGLNALKATKIVDDAFIDKQWKSFLAGSSKTKWSHIWHLVVLGQWIKQNLN